MPSTTRHCFALDLKNDPALIAEYRRWHEQVWPDVLRSLRDAGIVRMEIYLRGCRLFMIMDVDARFSLDAKARADAANPVVQAWEQMMWRFQEALPDAAPGEKWAPMECVFTLAEE